MNENKVNFFKFLSSKLRNGFNLSHKHYKGNNARYLNKPYSKHFIF